ncbi:hypothetical protein LEP1GSC192_2474 [Leptospira sp. B5-022]|nr:hypothetical protein LEP1GSC192_2474 [Leptospira sp. B5-022]
MVSFSVREPRHFNFRGPIAESADALKSEIYDTPQPRGFSIAGKIWLIPCKTDITVAGQRGIFTRLPP